MTSMLPYFVIWFFGLFGIDLTFILDFYLGVEETKIAIIIFLLSLILLWSGVIYLHLKDRKKKNDSKN